MLFGLLGLVSFALGWQLRGWYSPDHSRQNQEITASTADLEPLRVKIEQLETDLAAAKARNQSLQSKLASETQQLQEAPQEPAEPAANDSRHRQNSAGGSSIPALETLTSAQIPLATAEAIRDLIAQNRLAMLRLRDQAEREGWINSTRYAQELRKLLDPTHGIRDQFGDDIYDRYLYASEIPNRVIATAVYPDSAASAAGIQEGDTVLSYASKNIYSMRDLQQATLEGEAGESVLVVLKRDGATLSITVPRGPLGIELRMESHAPDS
jgi:hypothetical protein